MQLPRDPIPILGALVVAGALLTLLGELAERRWLVYVFKPLTTALVITAALLDQPTAPPFYRRAIVAGLALSWFGDVFLMLPRDRFVAGLAAFFVAHLCYVAGFLSLGAPVLSLTVLVPLLGYAVLLLSRVQPGAGRLAPVVALYAGALVSMAWLAVGRALHVHTMPALFAAGGALLFVISDSALAYDRFRVAFNKAPFIVLTTYWAAQWLIARSV